MISRFRVILVAALVAAFATPMLAVTYIVPPDAEMIQKSDDIVIATGVSAMSERDAHGSIVTRYTLRVSETLKGDLAPGAHLVVTELGGVVGEFARMIPGAPEYEPGVRYLVFTETNRDFEPATFGMSLGQFRFVDDKARVLAVRQSIHGYDQNFEEHEELARDAELFTAYIRDTVKQRGGKTDYFVAEARERQIAAEWKIGTNAFSRNSYLMQNGDGRGFRWQNADQSWVRSGTQPGTSDAAAAVSLAFSEWNSTGTSINYSDAGVDNTALGGLISDDDKNAILLGDPNNEISDGSGVAGRGGISMATGTYTLGGETFWGTAEGDVVIQNMTFNQACLNGVMTHEVGHTLGFRHSNQPPTSGGESTTAAIMNSSVSCGLNGALQTYDQTAAETVYGSGSPVCNPPTISTHPPNRNIDLGASAQLSVVAGGTGPLTFTWFTGPAGNTTTQVGTGNPIAVSPTATTTYWVRVSNSCPGSPVNSNVATVTVTCANPAITTISPTSITITGGQSTTLQVTATGSNLSFQWFRGAAGDRSNPVGTNSNRLTVSPTETSQYWVHVSGACGAPVSSGAVTVTVIPCADITVNPPTATAGVGAGKYALNVTASSAATPLTFGWFRGGTPGFGGTAIGSGATVNVTVTQATGFWARVQNGCGRVEFSSLITVAPCTLPSITAQPQDQTINSGAMASLSIGFTTGATVKWYRGTVGDKSSQVGTTANVNVGPLTQTTKFWAEVSTSCGPVSSREVTVTVRQLSELVPMLNGRFFIQVNYKNQFDNDKTGKLLGRSLFSTALSETAVFTFGDQNVVELLVRVSDARPFDDNIHVFLGGLSDVEFSVVVTDSLSGMIHEYRKPANQLVGVIDRTTFPATNVLVPPVALKIEPTAETSTIRLLNNRFEVRMRYRNQFTNPAGTGYMNARSVASSSTTETAVFFFDENVGSAEWMVRFSDARPFANRIDLFHGGLSDVEFTIEVLDTKTGERREYQKGPFSLAGQVDRDSFQP